MLRITKTFEDNQTMTLRLDGRLTSALLSELEEQFSVGGSNGKKFVVLDFSGVTFIDDDAAKRVAQLKGDGIRIINGSLFIETLLRSTEG